MANLVTFAKKLWKDATSGGTPITAAELNRMEGGINDCATQINRLGDSVSRSVTKRNQAVEASVGGDMSYNRPQPIQVGVKTKTSDYVFCVMNDGISLYNNATEQVVWMITAK